MRSIKMLKINDDELKWDASIIKYSDEYQSIIIKFDNHPIWVDLVIGSDHVSLEARKESGERAFRAAFKPSEIE